MLVLAGAGTGKTRVLTTRLAHILATGRARPWELLAVTFTNKAAREMRERITAIIGPQAEGLRWLGTFHSVAAQILRRHAELVGLKSNYTILDDDDQERLIKQLLEAENIDAKRWTPEHAGRPDRPLEEPRLDARQAAAAGERAISPTASGQALYRLYQERLRVLNACDFGDLLLHNLTIFTGHPDVLADYHEPVPLHAGRRVPGHQRRPVPVAAAAGPEAGRTSAASATTTSRSTAGAAPRWTTSCASSATSRAPR